MKCEAVHMLIIFTNIVGFNIGPSGAIGVIIEWGPEVYIGLPSH